MKRTYIATAAALALAACSGNGASENTIANQPEAAANVIDDSANSAAFNESNNAITGMPDATPPVAAPSAAPPAETPRAKAETPPPPRRPNPPARPAPKAEPVDPHAGHDMNAMNHQ